MGYLGKNTTEANKYKGYLEKGLICYQLATQARLCSKESMVEQYVADFYKLTGTDPNCNCCKDESSPVIPTTIVNGTDGTDGETPEFRLTGDSIFQYKFPSDTVWTTIIDFSTIKGADGKSFLQGSGAPSNGLGINDDTYLDIATYDIYEKSAGSWSVTGNIKGDSGATILVNNYVQVVTTTTSTDEVLKTYTFSANSFSANGIMVEIEAIYERIINNNSTSGGEFILGSHTEGCYLAGYTNANNLKIKYKLTRISSTVLVLERERYTMSGQTVVDCSITKFNVPVVFDFTQTIDLRLTAYDAVLGTTGITQFRITKYKI